MLRTPDCDGRHAKLTGVMRTTTENKKAVVKFDANKIIKAAVGSARLEGYKGKVEDFADDEVAAAPPPEPEEAQHNLRP